MKIITTLFFLLCFTNSFALSPYNENWKQESYYLKVIFGIV